MCISIAVPQAGDALARMMGETRRLFARYKGTGPQGLWRGRYQSCPLDEATHAKAALAYVSFNPVRAGLGRDGQWPWLMGETLSTAHRR